MAESELPPTAVERCTSILLHNIMSYLALIDIMRVMRVNRHWREQALNHPTYYGYLCLDPPENLQSFLLRLSRSAGRPITIRVDVLQQSYAPMIMRELGNHLAHTTFLNLGISSQLSVPAVLQYLCRPAPNLRRLILRIGPLTDMSLDLLFVRPPALPADLFGAHAPALKSADISDFDLSFGIPDCFANITSIAFCGSGWRNLVLPDPFQRCPKLQELHLANSVTLHPVMCRAPQVWRRMTHVSFTAPETANGWPAFRLPLNQVQKITVRLGNAASALALANTLSGPLHVTFPPLLRSSAVSPLYTAILRTVSPSDNRSRVLEGTLHMPAGYCPFPAFSAPALANRIRRLDLPLDVWDALVGMGTFGPLNTLDELVLGVDADAEFTRSRPRLSCPKLQRLVLRCAQPTLVIDLAAAAKFLLASLPNAPFPLKLKLDGVELAGDLTDFPATFSTCVQRAT